MRSVIKMYQCIKKHYELPRGSIIRKSPKPDNSVPKLIATLAIINISIIVSLPKDGE